MNPFSNTALKERHVLITGATGGIGYQTALTTAAMGANVTVTGRNEAKLDELKNELLKITDEDRIFAKTSDITSAGGREELAVAAADRFGPVRGLVNSAGIAGGAPLEDLSEEQMREIMELNYFATVMLTQLIYKDMLKSLNNEQAAIVNVSSLSGLRGTFGNTAYSASKFALNGFTQSLAVEAIRHNIRVNAVCPGFVDTQMGLDAIKRKADRNGISFEEQLKQVEAGLPSGHITKTEDVANTISFLLTDAAHNIAGESVKISGGSVL